MPYMKQATHFKKALSRASYAGSRCLGGVYRTSAADGYDRIAFIFVIKCRDLLSLRDGRVIFDPVIDHVARLPVVDERLEKCGLRDLRTRDDQRPVDLISVQNIGYGKKGVYSLNLLCELSLSMPDMVSCYFLIYPASTF